MAAASAEGGVKPSLSTTPPSFYIFPYSQTPPAGIPAEHRKILLLIRHAQGAACPSLHFLRALFSPLPFSFPAPLPSLTAHLLCNPPPLPPPTRAGTHNVAVAKSGGQDGGLEEPEYKNEAWADARLTPIGEEQSATLQPVLAALPHPEIVLVSPLSRTIQTALIAFAGAASPVSLVCEELVRERNGAHPCDRRRPTAELRRDFPSVDFSPLRAEADDTWTPAREPWEGTVGRATAFLHKLAALPQSTVACVTHNDFLQALLLEAPELRAMDPALRKKFANAECMPLWFVFSESLPQGDPMSHKELQGSPR
jgi:broad specificity phosphatase PhoE